MQSCKILLLQGSLKMKFNLVLLLKVKVKHFMFSHQFNIMRSVSILHATSEIEYNENSKNWTDVLIFRYCCTSV